MNKTLYDYKIIYPKLSEDELEILFIKDTMKEIGKVNVSLKEAEEVWNNHSLSVFASWLGISEKSTMEGLFSEIVSKDVLDLKAKSEIFEILEDENRKI